MIENYRSELVWRRDAHAIRTSARGLQRAGFTGGWLDAGERRPGAAPVASRSWRVAGCCCCGAGCRAAAGARPTTRRHAALLGDGARGRGRRPADARSSSARNPGIHVACSRFPWTAAHEKLLTAFAGDVTARRLPARQHLGAGVRRARRARAARRRTSRASPACARDDYFPGIWDTNVVDGTHVRACRGTSTRACCSTAATCCAQAGYAEPPHDWAEWRAAMARDQARAWRPRRYRDPAAAQRMRPAARSLGAAAGAPLLRDDGRSALSADPRFRRALDFYVGAVPTTASRRR